MKNEPSTTSDKPKGRARKAERQPPLPGKKDATGTDEPDTSRLHLLERRGHRWERRNAHA